MRERRLQASASRDHFDEQGALLGELSNESIFRYCKLDKRVKYGDLKKPVSWLCVCGQPCESLPEITAHVNNKKRGACRYIMQKVFFDLNVEDF